MADLYPDGRGYHEAHEPYIAAVAAALDAAGFPTADFYADPNDPRDGAIKLDLGRQGTIGGQPIWRHDEVWIGWQEERGWWLLTEDRRPNGQDPSRFVYGLGVATVAAPRSVVLGVAERAGLTLELDDDGHPDVDFPGHQFTDDNVPLELALRHYRQDATGRPEPRDCGCPWWQDSHPVGPGCPTYTGPSDAPLDLGRRE